MADYGFPTAGQADAWPSKISGITHHMGRVRLKCHQDALLELRGGRAATAEVN